MTEKKLQWDQHTVAEDEILRLERETATIETAEQAREAAELSSHADIWDKIRAYAEECDNVLAKNGFPAAVERIAHNGARDWWPISAADKTPGEKRRSKCGADFVKEHALDFSDAWFAADIGLKCRRALEHLEKGDAGKPFHYAMMFEIASRRKDWQWRSGRGRDILTGRSVRKGGRQGAEERRGKMEPETQRRLAEMQRLVDGGKSVKAAAETLARRGIGKSGAANRQLWHRHRNM